MIKLKDLLPEGFKKIAKKNVKYKDKYGTWNWSIESGIDTDVMGGNTPKVILFYQHEDETGFPSSGGNTFWLKHKNGKPYTPQEAKALVNKIANKKIMDFQKKSQNPSGSGQNVYYQDGKFIREGNIGITTKKGKSIYLTHKTSGKEIVVQNTPSILKKYKKLGYLISMPEGKLTEAKETIFDVAAKVMKDKQAYPYKSGRGKTLVDMQSANLLTKVFKKVNPKMKKILADLGYKNPAQLMNTLWAVARSA